MSLRDKSEEEIREAVASANSFQGALRILTGVNKPHNGVQSRWLRAKIDELKIDISHMTHSNKGFHFPKACLSDPEYLNKVFSLNSPLVRSHRREIILKLKLIPYKCAICGQDHYWNGKELSLTLDHINGNHLDNRLENLRFVCPNCDRQLNTFGNKNKVRYVSSVIKPRKVNNCSVCGKEISRGYQMCAECRKVDRCKNIPSKEELENELKNFTSFLAMGRKYGVSDNAVRKWCKKYSLPYRTSDIKKLTNS